MYGSRPTIAIEKAIDTIRDGGNFEKKRYNIQVKRCHKGEYYYVRHWNTIVAIGRGTDMPFAMRTLGWNTVTTLNLLRNLGFPIYSKRIAVGERVNEQTHRKNKIYESVIHINDRPMINPKSGKVDYDSWYSTEGFYLGDVDSLNLW